MGVLRAIKRSPLVVLAILPGIASAQQYNLTSEDLQPKTEYNFDLPTAAELSNPNRMDEYRAMAEEIGRKSAVDTMEHIEKVGKKLGLVAEDSSAMAGGETAGVAVLPEGFRATILVSRAMGEGALKDLLARYKLRKDVRIVFRGVPSDMTVPEFAYWLKELAAPGEDELTDLNVTIDPELFALVGASLAPTTVLEDLSRPFDGGAGEVDANFVVARAEGYSDADWLFEQSQKGQTDLRNANAVEIEEEDLRERAEREAAQVAARLTRDPDVLKNRFWERTAREMSLYGPPPAAVDRKRQLHFLFRTEEAIKDHNGNILAHPGEVFQPRDVMAFDRRIIVFNPNRDPEVAFVDQALSQPREGVSKVMLIATEVPRTEPGQEPWDGLQALIDRYKVQVFLLNDQFAASFKIEATPTEIYPEVIAGAVEVISEERSLQ